MKENKSAKNVFYFNPLYITDLQKTVPFNTAVYRSEFNKIHQQSNQS